MERRKWEDLRMTCLVGIFAKLGLRDLILGVPFVCRSWYRASLHPLCWKVLNFHELDLEFSDFVETLEKEYRLVESSFSGFLKLVINRSQRSVVELTLPHGTYTPQDLAYVSQVCPALKVLVLHQLRRENERDFPKLVGKWKDLEVLHIGDTQSSFKEILAEIGRHCKNFTSLQTSGWIGDEETFAIITSLPKIKNLYLSDSFLSKENLMKILKSCKELERLHVKRCYGFDVDDELLKMASSIKEFEYEGSRMREVYSDDDDHDGDGSSGVEDQCGQSSVIEDRSLVDEVPRCTDNNS